MKPADLLFADLDIVMGANGDFLSGSSMFKMEQEVRERYAERHAVQEWKALVNRIQIGGVMRAEITVMPRSVFFMTSLEQYLTVVIRVPERQHGEEIPIALTIPLPPKELAPTDKERMIVIRKVLHNLYLHEADEQFRLLEPAAESATASAPTYSRPFDPHVGQPRGKAEDFYP